ncbi:MULTISPECIES: hypothetical protein [Halorubrum]|nr:MULTISPECIES: hypothetical protein [Halorubrum]
MTDPTTGSKAPSAVPASAEHREHASADVAPELFERDADGEGR